VPVHGPARSAPAAAYDDEAADHDDETADHDDETADHDDLHHDDNDHDDNHYDEAVDHPPPSAALTPVPSVCSS